MSSALVPSMVALGGGVAVLAGIAVHEHRRDEAMRASRELLSLRFPAGMEANQVLAALNGISGLPYTNEIVCEVQATDGTVRHGLWVPKAVRGALTATLTGVIPGLRISDADSLMGGATLALKLFVPTPLVLSTDGPAEVSRALLNGLGRLRSGDQVVVRWAARPGMGRSWQPPAEPNQRERETERAWKAKTSERTFTVSGLVLVHAASLGRARELAGHVESIVRARRGAVGAIRVTTGRGGSLGALPKTTRSSGTLTSAELLPLLGWPLGSDVPMGVEVGASRELLVPAHVARHGRQLFVGRDGFGERPVAIDATAARHSMAVVGPSGVGKSVLFTRAILSDIENGFGGIVIDPKADLIDSILNRVKPEHADRIVVLDPGDRRPVPGLAVLSGGDPNLRTDVLAGALKSIFGDAWGVRSDFYGRLAIATLSETPGASLAEIGRLFYEDGFRRAAVARLRDPFLLTSWQAYEALSPAARAEHVQAPMARVMALLSRPRVRAILASPEARLDIPKLLAERKWLLVSLAPGQLGEAGATIVGASLIYLVWSAIEARVALAPERRHPIFLYVDELSTLTSGLPFGFELLAERARGLGAGLAVAIQTLGRIPEPTRSALLGNVASFITFRAPAGEAARLSRQLPGLTDRDVMGLARFEVAARVGTGTGSAVSVVTGRTEPLPPETGLADSIRDASAARYGARPESTSEPAPTVTAPADSGLLGAERRQA